MTDPVHEYMTARGFSWLGESNAWFKGSLRFESNEARYLYLSSLEAARVELDKMDEADDDLIFLDDGGLRYINARREELDRQIAVVKGEGHE